MASPNRNDFLDAMQVSLTAALTVQEVYGYQSRDLNRQSPVVRILSAGSERPQLTLKGSRSTLYFIIEIWVLQSESATGWTEEDAERALNDIEAATADWIVANRTNDTWQKIYHTRPSVVSVINDTHGETHLLERIPVTAEAYT